jgi:hypothetical protein
MMNFGHKLDKGRNQNKQGPICSPNLVIIQIGVATRINKVQSMIEF